MAAEALAPRLRGVATRGPLVPGLVLALAVAIPFVMSSDRWLRVLMLVLVYVVLASGLNLLVGFTGLLDLGYVAFFTVGAYLTSILTVKVAENAWGMAPEDTWWLFFLNLPLAVIVAAAFGAILGYPTLRARGDYLAIMTLAFGEVIRLVAINWDGLTNGPVGIRGVPPVQVAGTSLMQPWQLYFVALVIAVVAVVTITRLVRSFIGRAWVAIREDQTVAEAVGIPSHRYKLLAYMSGAAYAGLVGVFFAHAQQFVNPDSFTLDDNLLILSLVVLGGAGTIWGPVVGALIWIVFQEWAGDLQLVADHPELRYAALGLLILIVITRMPRGLVRQRVRLGLAPSVERPVAEGDAVRDVLAAATADDGPADDGRPVVAVRGLTCRFGGVTAVDDVHLEVRPGEILGVIGPNGAGKTTLFNALSGVGPRTDGELTVGGTAIPRGANAATVAGMGMARTFQNIRLFGAMTVLENVMTGGHRRFKGTPPGVIAGRPRIRRREREVQEQAARLLAYVGLWEEREREAATLSYGHQRRVEIARALMTGPRVLLLDEPAAGMNHTETAELTSLIRRIRDDGVSVVLIEHDMALLMGLSDRVVALDQGALIAEGTPDEVQRHPEVLRAYLGTT